MLNSILSKLNLCHIEELNNANNTIKSQSKIIDQLNELIRNLKEQLKFSHRQSSAISSKNEEYLSDIRIRDEEISSLKQELIDANSRCNQLKDIDLDGIIHIEEAKAILKNYKDAENEGRITVSPCRPGSNVYWISKGFDASVKPYAVIFNEELGYAIIELTVSSIVTDKSGTMILMDTIKCIENRPSFHIKDFGRCIFSNLDDANTVFRDIVINSDKEFSKTNGLQNKQ